MYRILGADNQEYGPVPAETIRRWISERRLDARSMVRREGDQAWKRLAEFPEFNVPSVSGPTPPGAPATPSASALPTLSGGRKTCGMAVAALILGFVAPCTVGISGLVGAIVAILALRKISRSQGRLGGKGLAIAGLVLSLLFLVVTPPLFMAAMMAKHMGRGNFGNFDPSGECAGHIQQLATAVRSYANDNNDRFPAATNWCESIQQGVTGLNTFQCPSVPTSRCGYALNAAVAGKVRYDVAPDTVLLFESDQGWNAVGNASSLISVARHGSITVVLADGSIRSITPDAASSLRWTP